MTNPKKRPIIFSGEMVNAILNGRKTQTRRVIKPQPKLLPPVGIARQCLDNLRDDVWAHYVDFGNAIYKPIHKYKCPYGKPGDRFWVRECFCTYVPLKKTVSIHADGKQENIIYKASHKDALKKGIKEGLVYPRKAFESLWDSLAKKEYKWADNPWVWVIEFKRIGVSNE